MGLNNRFSSTGRHGLIVPFAALSITGKSLNFTLNSTIGRVHLSPADTRPTFVS